MCGAHRLLGRVQVLKVRMCPPPRPPPPPDSLVHTYVYKSGCARASRPCMYYQSTLNSQHIYIRTRAHTHYRHKCHTHGHTHTHTHRELTHTHL